MGVTFRLDGGYIDGRASGRLRGATIVFPLVSVGATENLLMAASLADGETVLVNAAREPDRCNAQSQARLVNAGFLAQARQLVAAGGNARLIFNNRLDAVVTGILVVMVTLILLESGRQWLGFLSGRKEARIKEAPFVATRLAEEQG
jgi:hypothetical protein